MVVDVVAIIHEFPKFLRRIGGFDVKGCVKSLCRGEVVGNGTHTTNTSGNNGQIFRAPALTEFLEAPKLGYLEIRVLHVTSIV
jgi:hypothetical protein